MAGNALPGWVCQSRDGYEIDSGTSARTASPTPGPVGIADHGAGAAGRRGAHAERTVTRSYAVSGKAGALGPMFLTEAVKRVPGTWYDLTEGTTELRIDEASLGLRPHADHEFRRLAKQTVHNLYHPATVDVDVHFITIGDTEIIKVRGRNGVCSFRFKPAEAKHASAALPKGADPLEPLNALIRGILDAVVQVR
jgi:hypothetical protein